MAENTRNRGQLGGEMDKLRSAVMGRVGSEATKRMGSLTERLTDFTSGNNNGGNGNGGNGNGGGSFKKAAGRKAGEKLAEGESPVKAALSAAGSGIKEKVTGLFKKGGGGGGGGKKLKVTNIVEEIDVGAPVDVVYNQWTQFQEFSGFMKKVESVDQKEDTEVDFKAQVLWSHRTWRGEILEQVPNKRIIWRSSGEKGRVDGAVTFHEIGPDLTRVVVVLEYYPQGLFERTGNIWRAQGRRVRLELKHFARHVMTELLLHPDEVEGWRGEIHDGEVTVSDEDARKRESGEDSGDEAGDESGDGRRSRRRRSSQRGESDEGSDRRRGEGQRGRRSSSGRTSPRGRQDARRSRASSGRGRGE